MGLSLSTTLEIKASELINDKQWLRVLLCAGGMNLPLSTHKLHLKSVLFLQLQLALQLSLEQPVVPLCAYGGMKWIVSSVTVK